MAMRSQRNRDIRDYAIHKRVYMYEVAERLGLPVSTMNYQLRGELAEDRKAEFMKAIDEIASGL